MAAALGTSKLWRIVSWSVVALGLLVPLLAMQFTTEVDWSEGDFLAAAALLGGAALLLELVLRVTASPWGRTVAAVVIAVGMLVVWAELAVGLFG
jgi:hypothetical protein